LACLVAAAAAELQALIPPTAGIGRRIVATPRTERLFDLYKIYVLAGRPGSGCSQGKPNIRHQ
jgi:hypothetical protein